jgi:hypothetical protein
MGVYDDDILDFDFVEDATRESPPARGSTPRQQPGGGGGDDRGPSRRPPLRGPQGSAPLLRLVGLVAFAILVVVVLAVWVQGCAESSKQTTYETYFQAIGEVGTDSANVGKKLNTLLTTPGLGQAELETKLFGLVQQQQQDVVRAEAIDTPGPARPPHDQAVEALQLRVRGLQGMLDVFKATKSDDDATAAGQQLAAQSQRLQASDIVWKDLFQSAVDEVAAARGVEASAPASVFVESSDLFTPRSLSAIWSRIHGASTGGTPSGLHGSQLTSVKAIPQGTQLSTQNETTVLVSTQLGFEVAVTNSGDSQEVQVEVTLTIPKQPTPIVKKGTIDVLDPNETKTVVFKDFPDVPFGDSTTVQVSVKPVPGEKNTTNNSAEFPVVFSIEQ